MMMDNTTLHHAIIQSTTSTASNTIQQQPGNSQRSTNEHDHFLTIRLLMQGKVCQYS